MDIFEIFQNISGNVWIYGGSFILILSILVFVHEWGHYIVARMCGVRVETFSIGFGREIAGFNDKNGTRWKFALIPVGGYVKLFGDMDPASAKHSEEIEGNDGNVRPLTEAEKKVAFYAKPVWKRALIVFAGPAINYIFAIILLTGLFALNGKPVTPPLGAAVIHDSSAYESEFMPHDRIVSIDGHDITSFEDIRREMMIALDTEKHFVVERNGELVDIYAQPRKVTREDRFGFEHSRGLLGLISPRHAINIDNIVTIDGQNFDSTEAVREALNEKMGQVFDITVSYKEDKTESYTVQPLAGNNEHINDPESDLFNILFLANSEENNFVKYDWHIALPKAVQETWRITTGTLEALGQMIMGTRSATELGGVIRIGAVAGDVAQQGLVALILFTALLSINLGLINLFPIPLLDGGHLVFYAVEAVLGRPIPDQIQEYAFRFGLTVLVCIMVFANLNDIMQLVL